MLNRLLTLFGVRLVRTDDVGLLESHLRREREITGALKKECEAWRSLAYAKSEVSDDVGERPETIAMLQDKARRRSELLDHLAMLCDVHPDNLDNPTISSVICERVTYWKHGQVPARDRLSVENARMRRALERAGISADPPEATFDVG